MQSLAPRIRVALATAFLACAGLASAADAAPAPSRALQLEDMFRFRRVSDPQVSPDGRQVVFVVTEVVKEENRTNADLWLVAADGSGTPRKLTHSPKHDRNPRWSPDGRWIAFESTRDGTPQIFLLPVAGGEPRKVTTLFTGASQPRWSPDGRTLAFVSSVYPEFSSRPFAESDRLNREKGEAQEKSKVKARVVDQLLFRHWDSWVEGQRQHVFVVAVNADGAAIGQPRDVTPGENDGVPNSMTFSEGDDFVFSPDGKEIVTALPPLPTREQAWTTNYDVWSINLTTGERRNLTEGNRAADNAPRFSPDGRYLAYRAQAVPGFEADRWQIWVLDRTNGQRRSLTANWDRSVGNFCWTPNGAALLVEAEEQAIGPIFRVDVTSGAVAPVVTGGVNTGMSLAADGRWFAFLHQEMTQPPEVARLDLGQTVAKPLTQMNAALLEPIAFTPPESVTVQGAGGTPVQMWIVKPPHFDPARKYPLVFWVHGGPQGAWTNAWSTRWNAQIWAAQGYVLALPNPRGSTGFGQQFTNEISRDWGGKVFEDLKACLTFMQQQSYIDATRMAAAGASYGGFMMNYFQGHLPGVFRCIVNHDGVYNFNTMYTTTDELWFDEYEHGLPWTDPEFEKFSPHRFAAAWSTPMLVVHGELDFRCPVSEGLAAFTTLQRKGVRSKLLLFPDEGHWVLKPQNSELWHKTVFSWLGDYLKTN
ncbi:S9 family peptidase [Opitutus sp. ER46]|uniref:dipeptidyl-peptidase 5 n=1 Tax=Opitutus sp. ER46 TaxID=2161864 RepID=UPI001304B53B|nr:S9 family peptidase [Opitutus sp. ER46]